MNRRVAFGILLGAVAGFVVGAAAYLVVTPMLEEASGWVREMQGLVWNLVPFLTILGAGAGGLLGGRSRRPGA